MKKNGAKTVLEIFLILGITFSPLKAFAGIPVFDGANFAQAIMEVYNSFQSNMNEAMEIQNQVEQIQYDILNLEKLEYSSIDEFKTSMGALVETLGKVQGVVEEVDGLSERFDEMFPEYYDKKGEIDSESFSKAADTWLEESRATTKRALETSARVLSGLPDTEGELTELMGRSSGAVGVLQAVQAGTEINAQVAKELMKMNAQMGTFFQASLIGAQKEDTKEQFKKKVVRDRFRGFEGLKPPAPVESTISGDR